MNTLGIAQAGMQASAARFRESAARTAVAGAQAPLIPPPDAQASPLTKSSIDIVEEQVKQRVEQQIYQANAKVVKTADEMQQSTIRLLA